MKKPHHILLFILPIIWLLVIQACSSSKTLVSGTEKVVTVPNKDEIWMLPPTLNYESIQTESALPASAYRGTEVMMVLTNQSQAQFEQKGFKVDLKKNYNLFSDPNQQLDFFRPAIPENLLADLHTVGNSPSLANILVVDLKVKVGEGNSWDPYSGAIASTNHYSRFRAVLIDASEGKVLWRNEVQLREIPSPNKKSFLDAIRILFSTIK